MMCFTVFFSKTLEKYVGLPTCIIVGGFNIPFPVYEQITMHSSFIIMLCKITQVVNIVVSFSLSHVHVGCLIMCHLCLRTLNARSTSFLVDSCANLNNFRFPSAVNEYESTHVAYSGYITSARYCPYLY